MSITVYPCATPHCLGEHITTNPDWIDYDVYCLDCDCAEETHGEFGFLIMPTVPDEKKCKICKKVVEKLWAISTGLSHIGVCWECKGKDSRENRGN